MKFDYVIGNPPYQLETSGEITTNGQKSRKNIFHYFQIAADEIAEEGSVMIYPAGRWIHQSGKGLKQFGLAQMNDHTMSKLYYFPNDKEVFGKASEIADGISIVVKDKRKTSDEFEYIYVAGDKEQHVPIKYPDDELISLNPRDIVITNKISNFVDKYNLTYLHDAILPRSLFGIESDFVYKNPKAVREFDGKINYQNEIKLLTNDKAGKAGRAKWFVASKDLIKQNRDKISEWQVVVSSANAGGQKRDNQIEIIDNHSAFGRVRVGLRSFKTKEEAQNFYNYANTYLIRYAFLMTDEALTSLAKKVPDLGDYTSSNEIIDFSDDINKQLFDICNLTDEEEDYIKNIIDNKRGKKDNGTNRY